MKLLKKWKIARLNERIARMEREESAVKQQLDYLTYKALPALREQRNRLTFPAINLF